jgi:leucine efflux protein
MLIEWGIVNFTGFVLGTIGIILLPGPNSLFVLALAVQNRNHANQSIWQQIKMPAAAALGIMVGDFILAGISIFGAASLLQKHAILFEIVKYMGAFYLAYLAFGMLKQAYAEYQHFKLNSLSKRLTVLKSDQVNQVKSENDIEENIQKEIENDLTNLLQGNSSRPNMTVQTQKDLHPQKPVIAFKTALSISLLNPKGIFFFIAFFIQFLKPGYQPFWLPALILIVVLQIISMTYLSSLIFVGSRLVILFKSHPYAKFTGFALVSILFFYFALQLLLTKM